MGFNGIVYTWFRGTNFEVQILFPYASQISYFPTQGGAYLLGYLDLQGILISSYSMLVFYLYLFLHATWRDTARGHASEIDSGVQPEVR